MKKGKKTIKEKYNVTISSQDDALKAPVKFSIRKVTVGGIVVILLGAFAFTTYIGINAITMTNKLDIATQELKVLVDQQYNALQENAGSIEKLNNNQAAIVDSIEGILDGVEADELSFLNDSLTEDIASKEMAYLSDSSQPQDTRTLKQSVEYGNGSVNNRVELVDWFNGGSELFPRYCEAVVIDVETGLSFNVRRFGGTFHADSEPLTAADTAIMKEIFGGHWTWDRRAIWVKIGDQYIAASMHGMPHMVNPTKNNDFDGHFCIHFLHSKVHATDAECPRHQAMVMESFTNADKLEEYINLYHY